jgi:hypothetical protein
VNAGEALRRLHVRGKQNVCNKLLVQAMACNLARILGQQIGAGTPRAAQDLAAALFLILLWRIGIEIGYLQPGAPSWHSGSSPTPLFRPQLGDNAAAENGRFRHGLLARLSAPEGFRIARMGRSATSQRLGAHENCAPEATS